MPTSAAGRQDTGIIGRTLRLMLALLLGWMSYTTMRQENADFNLRILAFALAITAFYVLLHLVVSSYAKRVNRWVGAALAVAPTIILFAAGNPLVKVAALAYVGLSLLLQTVRGDGSCEVLSVPTVLLRRPTHLAGVLFAPVDLIEKHLTGPGGLPG